VGLVVEGKRVYKIKIKHPENKDQVLYFTTNEYLIENNSIKFIDKFGREYIWNLEFFIGVEEVTGKEGFDNDH
jgi:hypothetical protein